MRRLKGDEAAGGTWSVAGNASVDPSQPYCVRLNEGRTISVFFYDGPGSRAIAFEGLLDSGEKFASRLTGGFGHRPPTRIRRNWRTSPPTAKATGTTTSMGRWRSRSRCTISKKKASPS